MNAIDLAYYPGCTLSSTAREIDAAVHYVCRALDIHLTALPDWNCCGSSSVHAVRPQLAVSLAARNLFQAQSMGRDLMVMCAGCANRLRVAANQLRHDDTSRRVNREILGATLDRDLHVFHLMDLLPHRLKEKPYVGALQRSLKGLRYVPYYGCLLAAPPELKHYPKLHGSMEAVMGRLGAETRPWGYQAKCCGAFLSVARPDIVAPMVDDIMDQARLAGADCVVTACAMCQLNLELRCQADKRMPVFSVVELLAYGLGASAWPDWFKKHLIDPLPLFRGKLSGR
ncbi:MAG: heterodisulfide reductase-related iron-sulfur binding cluster [Desulfosarcinaceae bacterium]|nr:heterodisulfide reductase-related iron-sulfur binding cluster [Desulfosarcinaceae bacterium]